jgi:hypothetical protein
MTGSPYSTLPRRLGSTSTSGLEPTRSPITTPFTLMPNPAQAPILELTEGSNFDGMRTTDASHFGTMRKTTNDASHFGTMRTTESSHFATGASHFGTMRSTTDATNRAASLGRNAGLNSSLNSSGCIEPTLKEVPRRPPGTNGLGICVRTPQIATNDDRESCV